MNTSVIRRRVADFLKQHAPFDAISEADLLELAGSGRVKFHESDEYFLRQGEAKKTAIWVIQQGRVELLEESGGSEKLRDVLGEGDVLGLDRFAGDGLCLYSARTTSDVILYGVSAALFESVLDRYPAVKRFVRAHFSVDGILGFGRTSWLDADAPPAEFLRARLVSVPADASVHEAILALMSANNGQAALVDADGRATGVLSAAELCGASDGCARAVARPCPPEIAAPFTTRFAVRTMIGAGSSELALMSEGAIEGLLTGDELAMFCGHNPAGLIRAIRRADSADELIPLLGQGRKLVLGALAQPHDVDDCASISTELVAAMADACIRLAAAGVIEAGIEPPRAASCWVMFGPSARGDFLGLTQPMPAAIYDDAHHEFDLADSAYFAALAGETNAWFHRCGLAHEDAHWPEGSQPGMPLSEWHRFYRETICDPLNSNLYGRREFFDLWPLAGDRTILKTVRERILQDLAGGEMAVPLLAHDTLAHLPSFTFFRGLVLELDGAQRESFDIAASAILPIADAARVFALARRHLAPVSTLARLEAAAADYPEGASILRDAAEAFRIALYYHTLESGARIEPGMLGKFDQRLLKTAFLSIQRLLEFTAATFDLE